MTSINEHCVSWRRLWRLAVAVGAGWLICLALLGSFLVAAPARAREPACVESQGGSATLSLPHVNVLADSSVTVPLTLNLPAGEVYAADIRLTYDRDVVSAARVGPGSLIAGWSVASNLSTPGEVRVAAAGANPITSGGILLEVGFQVIGAAGSSSDLTCTRGELNEGAILADLQSGRLRISVPAQADFAATPTVGVAPLAVQFSDTSTGDVDTWQWSFGDGGTSSQRSPVYTYTTAGVYTVTLAISGPGGSDTLTRTHAITAYERTQAAFTAAPTSGIAPLTVQFSDASTGDIEAWQWAFGDGEASAARSPAHTYAHTGVYTVSLAVSGPGGSGRMTRTDYITVTEPPPVLADFTANPTAGVRPLVVQFSDQSIGNVTTWLWSFGDGAASSERSPVHTYTTAGVYTVTLAVSGPGGSDRITRTDYITAYERAHAGFTAAPTSGIAPLAVQFSDASTGDVDTWQWAFGDGGASSERNPSRTYTVRGVYSVTLAVSGPGGSDWITRTNYITAYQRAQAAFTATPTSGYVPLAVQFTDASTGDVDAWQWSFGDGQAGTGHHPVHTYTARGVYTVTLGVSGPGGTDSLMRVALIHVEAPPTPAPPVAAFAATPLHGAAPLVVHFTDLSTGTISNWRWDFGDGSMSSARHPAHTYAGAGTYTVALAVSGPAGTDVLTRTDFIRVEEPARVYLPVVLRNW